MEGRLINPRIVFNQAIKDSFDNTLVILFNGQEIHRLELNLPYSMPDLEVETLISTLMQNFAIENYGKPMPNSMTEWDWPEWDKLLYGTP